jgi:hypothetical protein
MSSVVEELLILGTDEQDAERQIALWLSQNPAIKVVRIHEIKREPLSLLTLIGGRRVPRVSITVEYHYDDSGAEADVQRSPAVAPTEEHHGDEYADGSRDQSAREDLFAAQAHRNMKEMAQHGSSQHGGKDSAE